MHSLPLLNLFFFFNQMNKLLLQIAKKITAIANFYKEE